MAELNEKMVVLLNALTNKDCQKLCHRVVDGLCGREFPHKGDYSTTWSLQEWLELLGSLTALFHLAVVNKNSDEVVLAYLSNVSNSQAEAVLSVLRAREEEIRRTLLDRTNSTSTASLQDFEWQLKLALSSDKISSLHTPLLSLSLDMQENGALQSVTVEMNGKELGMLISSLESANKLALSSDKISSLHTPLLSLSLDMQENGALQSVTVEMNGKELGMLISSLESANKLALSSDKISSLHTPLLSLSLDMQENGALQSVTVEMNGKELGMLISSLESANKLALSSDKISSLHTPLLSLSLDMQENGALQSVTVEMNGKELGMLISSLESANKIVLQLK